MKTLKCLLISFVLVSRLQAQINLTGNTIPTEIIRSITIPVDTISLARSLAYEKNFATADRLLTKYNADHSDIHGLALHAQVFYWMKANDRSIKTYEKALKLFPASSIQLDYARMLFQSGRLKQARVRLKAYEMHDSANVEADIMTAYINLWNGKTGPAAKIAGQVLQKYPGNEEAKDVIRQISNYTMPYLKTGTEYFSDDQPLEGSTFYAETGVYKSWLFAPTAQATAYQYRNEHKVFHAMWMQASNTIQLGMKSKIKLKAGLFQQNSVGKPLTGGLELSQQFARNFLLQAGIEKRPYQYTVSSLNTLVMENVSGVSISYNRKDKWLGKAGYELLRYADANKINTAYLWMLAPVYSNAHFSVSGGYAFRYADAVSSNFISTRSLSQLTSNVYKGVSGVFSPYFTPEEQKIHSALASVKIFPSKHFQFSSRVSIGVDAKAHNPYLWLDKYGGEYTIYRDYTPVAFKPATLVNELSYKASNYLSIGASHTYDQVLYYKIHKGSVEVKYTFCK
jgi:hypothetical protein